MDITRVTLPRTLPVQQERPPQVTIPQTRIERERLKVLVERYVREARPVPPLPVAELREHADAVVARAGAPALYRDYTAVLVNNAAWHETLAGIPYERRLLLLPKCLRVEAKCPAPFDEFGLLCKRCGLCSIQDLQEEAERLGYAVLVAEGSALVTAIIQTGKIDAIVGVSCLSVLERAFPFMEAAAVPGVAIPLLQDDCIDTNVDLEWVWDVIHLTSDDRTYRMDLDAIRREVDGWFTPAGLDALLGAPATETERLARGWLSRAGKRWRPFLAVCAYRAFKQDPDAAFPDGLKRVAIAIECFHKASLVHDDIEDDDRSRYETDTLHAEWGVPVALNAGDLLLGEGYRLLAESGAPPSVIAAMVRAAAAGHRTLALGQGAELLWTRNPGPLAPAQVLDIFRRKTAPAFEVALSVGALFAGENQDTFAEPFAAYSEALGIAYQIRDDLDDLAAGATSDVGAGRLSLPIAVALERAAAKPEWRPVFTAAWARSLAPEAIAQLREGLEALQVEDRCRMLLEGYKEQAIHALADVDSPTLKGLLRRIVGKIFNELEVKGWCSEFEARNAAGGAAGAPAAR
ncbi:MAG TPA: polyprenyl synthetase family protein [Vicinamibacterales bacterium]|jgi:geranylgeranyl pyrophosphate synthase